MLAALQRVSLINTQGAENGPVEKKVRSAREDLYLDPKHPCENTGLGREPVTTAQGFGGRQGDHWELLDTQGQWAILSQENPE